RPGRSPRGTRATSRGGAPPRARAPRPRARRGPLCRAPRGTSRTRRRGSSTGSARRPETSFEHRGHAARLEVGSLDAVEDASIPYRGTVGGDVHSTPRSDLFGGILRPRVGAGLPDLVFILIRHVFLVTKELLDGLAAGRVLHGGAGAPMKASRV